MYSKIIFFIGTWYIVHASVITLHDYDDNVQSLLTSEDSSLSRACNNQECNQRCRRLKYPGGVCVNGRCKCDNFNTLEDFTSLVEEYISRRCNPEKCNKKCQNKKLPGGKCVKRRCKCDKPERVEGSLTAGVIVDDDYEEFDLPFNELEAAERENTEVFSDSTDFEDRRRCISRICNYKCQTKGLGSGTCLIDRCKCSKEAVEREFATEDTDENRDEVMDMLDVVGEAERETADQLSGGRRCIPRLCNLRCRRRGFDSGTCVNGECKCAKNEYSTQHSPTVPEGVEES